MNRALLLTALALGAGCNSSPVSLSGSISQAFDLSFSSDQLTRNANAFQVTYLRSDGNEIVMRVTVDTTGLTIRGGLPINLAGDVTPGQPRTSVTRAVANEPLRVLPDVSNGLMTLNDNAVPGQNSSGSFGLTFAMGSALGSGYSLNGNFEGVVVAVP